jgi:hypothetical protein
MEPTTDQLALAGLEQAMRDAGIDPRRPPQRPATPAEPTQAKPPPSTCTATTNRGQPCVNGARRSGLCHLHDPAVQCGADMGFGVRCTAPTGGGLCTKHQRGQPSLF